MGNITYLNVNKNLQAENEFIKRYDDFIDATNTETFESFIREIAQTFYIKGFSDGSAAESKKAAY